MSAPILLPKLPWKPSPKPLPRMASLLRFPWTATRVGLVPHKGATFLLPLCVFVTAWESSCSSAIRITPNPHGFVERYHRTLNQECLSPSRPKTLEEVRQMTDAFATHYNWQRPHQGIACGNQPPRVAFPDLPSLPRVPDLVNPDAWLSDVKEQHLVRKVNRQGFVKVDLYPYYLSNKLAGQKVTLAIHADEQSLEGSVAKIFKPIKLMRIRKSYVSKTCRRCAPFLKRHALYCNSTLVFDEFKNFCNTTAKGGKGG